MKPFITLSFLMLLSMFKLQAQDLSSVTGNVVYSDSEEAVSGATILLADTIRGINAGFITNERGQFSFSDVQQGDYTLTITMSGFEQVMIPVPVNARTIDLGTLALGGKIFNMDEVLIEGEEATAEQRGDTVEYNASAFTTNPDASARDLVQKMPGVVMENGQLKAQGETVERVLVDGKVFFGDDPNAALQNLPAEVVDKVQVLDQQSDQAQFTGFEDGETTKTINIITKPDKRIGQFGRLYGGFGQPENRYRAGGSLNYFNGDLRLTVLGLSNNINQQNFSEEDLVGVSGGGGRRRWGRRRGGDFLIGSQNGITTSQAAGLNFSDEWGEGIEVSGSYFFNYSDNFALSDVNRAILVEGDTGQVYQELSESNRQNLNHRFNGRLEYKINEYNEIRLRPRMSYQRNQGFSLDSGLTTIGGQLANDFLNQSASDLTAFSFSNDLTYQHKFNDEGRTISIELETDYDNGGGNRDLNSTINYFTEPGSVDSTDQTSIQASNAWDVELEVEFNEPIGDWGRFQVEYEYNPRFNDASTRTFAFDRTTEGYNRLDTSLSNVFVNTYTRHELGTGLRLSLDDDNFTGYFSAGYQLARLDNDQTFPNELTTQTDFGGIVARAYVRWDLNDNHNLRFYYRTDTDPPSVSQLQDVVDNSNPLQLRTGNPDLEQSYQHFGVLRFSSTNTSTSSNLYTVIRGSVTQNFVGDATYIAEKDSRVIRDIVLQPGAQLRLPVNLDNQMDFSAEVTYGKQIEALKLNMNIDVSGNYSRLPSLINDATNFSNNYRLGLGLTLSSNINENIDFTISSRANVNEVINTLRDELNTQFYSQSSMARVNWIFWKGIVVRSQVTHQLFSGLSDGFDQSFWLWNGSLGKKVFPNQQGEFSLSVFDALQQNTSIQRNVTATYIEDVRDLVLQRYFMLNFTYNFRHFNGPDPEMDDRRGRR